MENRDYKKRIIDRILSEKLDTFGAILIEGPKWCGKTWTMERHAKSVTSLMDRSTRLMTELDPSSALAGESPHGIDEWQAVPDVWDEVRSAVDRNPERGQFLLTGSVTPPAKAIQHSGIGRISRMRMRTLSLYESGFSEGKISLSDLLSSEKITPSKTEKNIHGIILAACEGGWPINLTAKIAAPLEISYDYLEGLTVPSEDEKTVIRNIPGFRALLSSLARNNASIVKSGTLHNDISKATEDIAAKTLSAYMQYLRDSFLLEEIPGWNPQIRSKARILSSPKRFLADPSLAVAALGAYPEMYERDLQAFGNIFEGLCLRDLLIYTEANKGKLYHYRDNSDLEVDAIVEMRDGSWGGFEIKLGKGDIEDGTNSLIRLKEKILKSNGRAPNCLCVITGTNVAYQQDSGVSIIPITMLKN
jgi:predicted AAA+ superfamily ATPase